MYCALLMYGIRICWEFLFAKCATCVNFVMHVLQIHIKVYYHVLAQEYSITLGNACELHIVWGVNTPCVKRTELHLNNSVNTPTRQFEIYYECLYLNMAYVCIIVVYIETYTLFPEH